MATTKRRKKKSNNMPTLVIITIATFLTTVILFAVCINMMTSKNKNPSAITHSEASNNVSSNMIVSFDDTDTDDNISSDEEVSSEEVSSAPSHAAFEGTWKKTEVYESDKATLKISNQNDDGFAFSLTIWTNGKSDSISGNAKFTKTNTAVYTKGKASITFERGSKYVSIYHSGTNSALGFENMYTINGKFTTGTPNYYKQEEANNFDANVYKSGAIATALKKNLSADDYDLYLRMMSEGLKSPIAYERTVDKFGNKINVDSELNCVKYYANLSDLGEDMILICSNNGMFYLLFYNSDEIIYYTNDAAYAKKLPKAFQAVANNKGIAPTYK